MSEAIAVKPNQQWSGQRRAAHFGAAHWRVRCHCQSRWTQLPRNRYSVRPHGSKLLCWPLLISLLVTLSGCYTTYSTPAAHANLPPSNDLDISAYEVEFDLINTQGLTKEQIETAETSLISPIANQCSTPAYKKLDDASDRAGVLIKQNMVLNAADRYFADSEEIDKSARECMLHLGVTGAPYIVTVGRGRMTMPAYAASVREYAHQATTNRVVPAQIFLNLRSGGCGSRGGPGYRLANGKCASWNQ